MARLGWGTNQKYYFSKYEDGQTQCVQLTITAVGDDAESIQERWALVQFVDQQLHNIMEVFMLAQHKPLLYIPCPQCTHIQIKFDTIGTPICCPFKDKKVPKNYCIDILPLEKSSELLDFHWVCIVPFCVGRIIITWHPCKISPHLLIIPALQIR